MATNQKPIGIILQEAKLITPGQLEVALYEQKQFEMLLGEILSHHGWISQETADFFVDLWPTMVGQPLQGPIGYYLKMAHLLDEDQIERILQEQQRLGIRFGSVAVLKGWLKEETINFFVKNIASTAKDPPPPTALVLPVPQLNVLPRRSPRSIEAQDKETYYESYHGEPLPGTEIEEVNIITPAIPRQRCDSPRQAAETLILFDEQTGLNAQGHNE
ncbi:MULTISPECIES: hypothetical protein [unclassified Synechocystis]|uniref:hypothetical protein n=1 Tax=unclassified Synechocystis TaxID=2640012 RepID=UPI0004277E1C|nr:MULTISPECIES: hypothetical protein [unclassified Synechocystis]AIE72999.1 hypothetical protein D082_04700 [Synechocystis sp. PCC 6714]MCT0253521.1 hypothetical protein [Synechocystis sp. CS-94]